MTLLQAINYCLTTLGERSVTSADVKHTTVDLIKQAIEDKLEQFLFPGWYFNETTVTLYPDTNSQEIKVVDVIDIKPYRERLTLMGGKLFSLDRNSFTFSEPVTLRIVRVYPFEQIPNPAQVIVRNLALADVYSARFGEDTTVQLLMRDIQVATVALMKYELGQRQYNTVRSSVAVQKYIQSLRT